MIFECFQQPKQKPNMSTNVEHNSVSMSDEALYQALSPCETKTIQELALMIKATGLYDKLSDKEFDNLILSRRPLELLFMANATIYHKSL